jgi:uncharacterized protein (TIGR02453 family)
MDAPFTGFPGAMAFLGELRANNDRAWFTGHKAEYDRVCKAPAEAFMAALRPELEALAGTALGGKLFRIHRDVRFSKDKSPYNTHIHIGFQPLERGARRGGFYFGIDPDAASLGVGDFEFNGSDLVRYREAVDAAETGDALARLLNGLGARIADPELKRAPAPYPQDHPRGELLRRKSLNAWCDLDMDLASPDLVEAVLGRFKGLDPVNRWLTEALG